VSEWEQELRNMFLEKKKKGKKKKWLESRLPEV
jgi:hypothetical protein